MNRGTKKHSIVQQVNRSGSLKIISGISNARLNKDVYFDFINVENTKSKCQEKGLIFNDSSSLFPTIVGTGAFLLVGTWAHSAGNGWLPTIPGVNGRAAGFILPVKQSDYIFEVEYNYLPSNDNQTIIIYLSEVSDSNAIPFFTYTADLSAVASSLTTTLYTNDGDDTTTVRYGGVALVGTGIRTYKIKKQNGCLSVFDAKDSAWHDYEGHASDKSYSGKFHQLYLRATGVNVSSPIYFRSLRIQYL